MKHCERLAADLKVLADKTRLSILQRINQGERCGCELIEKLDISQPTLSHHLKILKAKGFIEGKREKTRVNHDVRKERLRALFADLMAFIEEEAACEEEEKHE